MKAILNRTVLAMAAAGLPCSMAAADLPEALTRVSADAPLIISISNVGSFFTEAEALTSSIRQAEAAAGIGEARKMFSMPGIDPNGSAAIVFSTLNGFGEMDNPPMVALVPVTDYNQVVTDLGGTGDGLELLEFQGEDVYIKNIGDGFAAIAPERQYLADFEAVEDSGDAHEDAIGASGGLLAEEHTFLMIADVEAFGPALLEGWGEAQQQMRMMGQMTGQGEQIDQQIATIDTILNTFTRDGQRGMLAFSAGETGVSIELGASFKAGSEIAGFFEQPGDAAELAERLPGGPYLFAMAFDTSSAGTQKLLKGASELNANSIPGLNMSQFIEGANGFAQVLGMNPAGIMGGLFVNTTMLVDVEDADAYIAGYGEALQKMNNQTANGVSMTTNFADQPQQVGGVEAYRWQMKMMPDLDTPGAQQMNMMMPMLFGPAGGPSGYVAAATDETVVMTYSTNSGNLSTAVKAAQEGGSLAGDALFRAQADRLHDDAVMVAYVDVGSIMRTVLPLVAMFAGPVDIEVPEAVSPIAMSMTADEGSMTFRTVVPTDVIELAISVGEKLDAMNEGGMGGGNQGGDPQF